MIGLQLLQKYLSGSLMPSAHGTIFCRRQEMVVKIGSCALTFALI